MQSGFSRDAIDDLTISCKHSLNTLKLKGSECVCVYARMAGVCVCVGGGGVECVCPDRWHAEIRGSSSYKKFLGILPIWRRMEDPVLIVSA